MGKDMESPLEPESETEKKMKNPANEENVDPKTSSSKPIVADIIRQFEERVLQKAQHQLPK